MAHPFGRRLPVSPARRFIDDLTHFAMQVPLCTMQRTLQLAPVAVAREAALPRPGWCALFLRAYGLVCARRPELRRAYVALPRPHFYEHPESIGSVAVERELGGEAVVLFTHVRGPENQSLAALQGHLTRFKTAPLESIALYRRLLKTSRWPRLMRRLLWWYGLNASGWRRARYLGTFGVSSVAGLGGSTLNLLTPVTTALNYGALAADGSLDARLTFDHRVLDGATAARALAELEAVLNGAVYDELRRMRRVAA